MNRTHWEHALAGLLIMALVFLVLTLFGVHGGHWAGATAGVFFFLGREYTQAERELAKAQGVNISDLHWYDGLKLWRWSLDAWLDLLFPLVACLLAAWLASLLL